MGLKAERDMRFLFLIFIALVGVIYLLTIIPAVGEHIEITFGELAVAFGTLLLAYYTYLLGFNDVLESRKERKRLRLKEQLEGFYALLMPYIDDFNDQTTREGFYRGKQDLMDRIQSKYEFLASPKLRELFRRFYDRTDYIYNWTEIINSIHDTILEDFQAFTEEYNRLSAE